MKLSKVLLLASALLLVACNSTSGTSTSITENTSSSEITSTSIVESSTSSSSSSLETSSTISSNTTSSSSSTDAREDQTLTISFYNPSCGSLSKEVIDTRLAEYINQEAGTTFVTAIKNTSCQVSNDIPSKGEKVLIIGAASSQGSLEFTFADMIKTVTITAQTYHKPYTDYATGNTIPNVDENSVLYINTHSVDLKPVNGEPVQKEYTDAINANKFKLTNGEEERSRVFIRSITFVY